MSIERTLFAFGGTMVMLTSLLALFHQPELDLVYPVYRVQLFAEFFYRLLSAELADEKIRHEIRGGTCPGRVTDACSGPPGIRRKI